MSSVFIGSKHTVFDVYPIRDKVFFLLVDPQNIVGESSDFKATLSTIDYLLKKQARVLLASSFGPLDGISLNLSKQDRDIALDAFHNEDGMGYTHFFSTLPSSVKMEVLKLIPSTKKEFLEDGAELRRGKTTFFSSVSLHEKSKALRTIFPRKEFYCCSTLSFVDSLRTIFPDVTVHFAPDCIAPPLQSLHRGEIMVLENLRYYKNETSLIYEERKQMADILERYIDVFINDSFATAHRFLASSVELPTVIQHGAAGNSMDRELAFYSKFLVHPSRPLAVVIAGKNIPEKLQLIHNLVGKVDRILVGGAVVYPFLVAKGYGVGMGYNTEDEDLMERTRTNSSYLKYKRKSAGNNGSVRSGSKKGDDRELIKCSEFAKEILESCEYYGVDLVLPVDHLAVKNMDLHADENPDVTCVDSSAIPGDVYLVDCGVNTIHLFSRFLRDCRTVFWTGSLGCTAQGYCKGTGDFATLVGNTTIISVVGGRHTLDVIRSVGMDSHFLHISSGGISSVEVLQGNPLPGVEALSDVAPRVDRSTTVSVNELLRRLPLFQGCSSHQLKVIAKKFVRRVHAKGDYLIYRNDRHARLWVVAQGGLVAYNHPEYSSLPARFVGKGQTIGMYEFITQATSNETVRAAQADTVTYHLSSSVLNELLNGHPDLAAQLFQNISEPLRLIALSEYQKQQSSKEMVNRAGNRSRIPLITHFPASASAWTDIIQDLINTLCMQKLSMRYTPFVPSGNNVLEITNEPQGPLSLAVTKLKLYEGLPYMMCGDLARNFVYHQICNFFSQPWIASIVSAAAIAPLRVLAYGISYSDISCKMLMDEMLISAAVSSAPLVAYAGSLAVQHKLERKRQCKTSYALQLLLTSIVRLMLGLVVVPGAVPALLFFLPNPPPVASGIRARLFRMRIKQLVGAASFGRWCVVR
ncbi:3-phosphoglycerate kinase, glycosomal [Angomonas deanei]|nr:3-phosphoglycerate kinase, glycosomal [Angomonas deanei]|eukprot:EPY38852.1 3-phosphoglycerate kinase, glycosomal [Angomonas deanei]